MTTLGGNQEKISVSVGPNCLQWTNGHISISAGAKNFLWRCLSGFQGAKFKQKNARQMRMAKQGELSG